MYTQDELFISQMQGITVLCTVLPDLHYRNWHNYLIEVIHDRG